MKACLAVCLLLGTAGTVAADDAFALHSQVGFGPTIAPERAEVTTEGGYVGGAGRFEGHLSAEGTLVAGLSLFIAASYGDENDGQKRPAIGAAYQIASPLDHPIGARVSVAFKPDGFDEPEGEIEGSLILSHLMGRDMVRAALVAGTDADGNEGDYEVGGSFLHRTTDRLAIGITGHFRHALVGNPMVRWDMIAGAVGDVAIGGRWRVELLAGVGAAQGNGAGPVGLGSVGIDL